jgi:hypothetical protein
VSIQGLVLNNQPYYNEAGYERYVGTPEAWGTSQRVALPWERLSCHPKDHAIPVAPAASRIRGICQWSLPPSREVCAQDMWGIPARVCWWDAHGWLQCHRTG